MEMLELIEMLPRNYEVEKETIAKMSYILKPFVTQKNIKDTLEENGFKGLFIITDDLYNSLFEGKSEENANGFYSIFDKIIVIRENEFLENPNIALHEMCHAYLDDRNVKKIDDIGSFSIGFGIEEGIATVIQNLDNYKNVSKVKPYYYHCQTHLFQQLNELYSYAKIKEYPNLLIHALKKPEIFVSLVRDIYYEILEKNVGSVDMIVSNRSAHRLLTITDLFVVNSTSITDVEQQLYSMSADMNSIYLTIADRDIYSGKKDNQLFRVPDICKCNYGILRLYKLFNMEDELKKYQLNNLDLLHEEMEKHISLLVDGGYEQPKNKILIR